MSKINEMFIIRGPYKNGKEIQDSECDICHCPRYPLASWPTDDDPYIKAIICFKCIDELKGLMNMGNTQTKGGKK